MSTTLRSHRGGIPCSRSRLPLPPHTHALPDSRDSLSRSGPAPAPQGKTSLLLSTLHKTRSKLRHLEFWLRSGYHNLASIPWLTARWWQITAAALIARSCLYILCLRVRTSAVHAHALPSNTEACVHKHGSIAPVLMVQCWRGAGFPTHCRVRTKHQRSMAMASVHRQAQARAPQGLVGFIFP